MLTSLTRSLATYYLMAGRTPKGGIDLGRVVEEEAKQRQERRKSLEWKRVKVIAGWLAG